MSLDTQKWNNNLQKVFVKISSATYKRSPYVQLSPKAWQSYIIYLKANLYELNGAVSSLEC